MQPLPKLIESLDVECRERSSTVRLVGCGARHTVAVLGNGDLFIWGRPDFGRLGRSKNDSSNEPVLVDALWRREVAEGGADRTRALGKMEIRELLEQQLNVHDILRYFPDIEADPEAALFLSKAVAIDLQSRVQSLQAELEQAATCLMPPQWPRFERAAHLQAHQDRETALERFIADQERAFEEKEREGLDILIQRKVELESQVETFEKSLFFQTQLSIRLAQELHQLGSQIDKEEVDRVEALAQAFK